MRYIFLVIFFTIVYLDAKEYYLNTKDRDKIDFMDKAKAQVTKSLNQDVQFKDIYYNKGVTGIKLVCGKHTKDKNNNLFFSFIYVSPNFMFFENETRNFHKIWNQLCKYDNRKTSVFAK